MLLKSIIIYNFKGYSGCTEIEELRPGHSIIVGENGAGKSNFLQALEFVMRCETKTMNKRNIAPLLSQRDTEGFVEIVISECDVLGVREFSIRKEFSLTSNITFYLNKKKVNKKTIMAFYEICGFYCNDSLFILTPLLVYKIAQLSRKDLLSYLLRSMGITIPETLKFIQRMFLIYEGQKEKIDHIFDFFDKEKIAQDEKNLKFSKKYVELKNALLAEITRRRIKKWSLKKIQLEANLSPFKGRSQDDSLSSTISILQHSHSEIQSILKHKQDILENLMSEESTLIQKKEKLKLSIQDIRKTVDLIKKRAKGTSDGNEISYIDNQIELIAAEIEVIGNEIKLKKDIISKIEMQLESKKTERLLLLLQIKRNNEFVTKEVRCNYVQTQINLLLVKIQNVEAEVHALSNSQDVLLKKKTNTNLLIQKLNEDKQQLDTPIQKNHLKKQLNELLNELRDFRRKEMMIEEEISAASKKFDEKTLNLKKKIGNALVNGAESVLKIVEACRTSESHQWLFDNYFGMVIENFDCPEDLSIAVETAIGNRLFAHIVTNNKTGTAILKEVNYNRLPGEATFLPIEEIKEFSCNYPSLKLAEPILNRITFEDHVAKIMKFLFGRIILCQNVDIAVDIMRKYDSFVCVTLEGDKICRSDIYGGYIQKSKCSRIIYLEIENLQKIQILKNEELENLQRSMRKLESDINCISSEIQKVQEKNEIQGMKENIDKLVEEKNTIEEELFSINKQIKKKNDIIDQLHLNKKILSDEVGEDIDIINEKVSAKIIKLNEDIEEGMKLLNENILELTVLESKLSKLENGLGLQKKLKELQEIDHSEIKKYLKQQQDYGVKKEILNNRLNFIRKEIAETEKSIEEANRERIKMEQEIKEKLELEPLINNEKKAKILEKILLCDRYLNEYKDKLSKIKYPSRLSTKYQNIDSSMLLEELHRINEILDKSLVPREIEEKKRIISLLLKKFENLQNCFMINYVIYSEFVDWLHSHVYESLGIISDNFTEMFDLITGGGEANLFLEDDGSPTNWPLLENITGLQLCVKFPSSPENWSLLSLSTSQKVQVILAFSLSLLKLGPVPLCIFDEIDRALTEEQKRFVCNKISDFRSLTQIFSSSHSYEWIKFGDTLYYVMFRNKRSYIKQLTDGEANNFLTEKLTSKSQSLSFVSVLDTTSSMGLL